jgi:ring-1,2-phenylacetyl-CoA epoxidase subunit PaaC
LAGVDSTVPDSAVVPALPAGSPVPDEDRLAFFRDDNQFRNVRLAELPNGEFAEAITRILMFSTWRFALFERLVRSRDAVLAAVAAKGVKELRYHRDFAARWFVTLAQGTGESRGRLIDALCGLWPLWAELTEPHPIESASAAAGVGVDPAEVDADLNAVVDQVLSTAGIERPDARPLAGVRTRKGRDGVHTEALSRLLAEMQVVARAHPMGTW